MNSFGRVISALVVFAAAFAFVEASVVVYLRFVWQPIHARLAPDEPADSIFPIIRLDQLEAEGPGHMRLLHTELAREAATLIMLGAVPLMTARNVRQWFAGFMIAFGVWDICFYGYLKILLDWPASLQTWDLLFLLPVPWVGPVWSPMLVSVAMIAAGVLILWRDRVGRPIWIDLYHAIGIGAGGLTVIVAFCCDWRNIVGGGMPNRFPWPLFSFGLAVGFITFLHAGRATTKLGRSPLVAESIPCESDLVRSDRGWCSVNSTRHRS